MNSTLPSSRVHPFLLLRYAVLGLPIAFVGLPIYVHLPKYYVDTYGVSLSLIGVVLLAARLMDAFADPVIGWLSDRYRDYRLRIMQLSSYTLAMGFVMLFYAPESLQGNAVVFWLCVALTIVYFSFSAVAINYYAMGVSLTTHYHEHSRIAAYREASILIGVVIAAALPSMLMEGGYSEQEAFQWFSLIFVPLVMVACWITTTALRAPRTHITEKPLSRSSDSSIFSTLRHSHFRWLYLLFLVNSLPVAITSTLFLFYVDDVLQLNEESGYLLALFFVSSAASIPLWLWVSKHIGKRRSLLIAMGLSIVTFIWAYLLGAGDFWPFFVICILSGMAIGGDLSLLPSLFSDTVQQHKDSAGTSFGIWQFLNKFNLALAAGIVLPLIEFLGYEGGEEPVGTEVLSFSYALLPCMIKCAAFVILLRSPLDRTHAKVIKKGTKK